MVLTIKLTADEKKKAASAQAAKKASAKKINDVEEETIEISDSRSEAELELLKALRAIK